MNRPTSLAHWVRDDIAYILPMAVFLLITQAGVTWPGLFPISYLVKTVLTALLLILLWPQFTKISWRFAWLGVIVGIIGVVQWVGMEKGILHLWPNYPRPSGKEFNPFKQINEPAFLWTFIVIRLAGPVLVVPFMEELFWRDFLWRTVIAPSDFKMEPIGTWDWRAFAVVTALFASVHIQWITALVWGSMIAILLVRTRSLGACIVAHGVTNLLLGVYVLYTHDWQFW